MMEKRITITELARDIANNRNLDVVDVERFVGLMFVVIEEALKSESMVRIKGLGTFKLVRVESRESVNVNTGQRFVIDEHTKVTFTPDATLRNQINKPFAEFETVVLNDDVEQEELERIDAEAILEEKEESVAEEPVVPLSEVEASELPEFVPDSAKDAVVEQHLETQYVTDMTVAQQHVEHQTIEPSIDMSQKKLSGHLNIWEAMALMLFVIVMMGLSYVAGYNHWLLNDDAAEQPVKVEKTIKSQSNENAQQTKVKAEKPAAQQDASTAVKVEEKTEAEKQAERSKEYQQVVGGTHVIVGVLEEHEVRTGESLRGLSIKYYGSKDFVPYILQLNQFANPDIIPLGYKLKMPILEKRLE